MRLLNRTSFKITVFYILWFALDSYMYYSDRFAVVMPNFQHATAPIDCSYLTLRELQRSSEILDIERFKYNFSSVNCLIDKLEKGNYKGVYIKNSTGGELQSSMKLNDYFNNNNLDFIIENACNSTCSFSLMVIKNAKMCHDSRMGIHLSKNNNPVREYINKTFNLTSGTAKKLFYQMESNGLNSKKYQDIFYKTPHDDIHFIGSQQALYNRMAKTVLNCDNYFDLN